MSYANLTNDQLIQEIWDRLNQVENLMQQGMSRAEELKRRLLAGSSVPVLISTPTPAPVVIEGNSTATAVSPAPAPTPSGTRTVTMGDVPFGGGGYIVANAVDLKTGIMWEGTDVQNCYLRRPGDAKWSTVFRKDTMAREELVRHGDMIDGIRIVDGLGSNMGTFAGTAGDRAYSQINGEVYTLDIDPTKPLDAPGGITATPWNLPLKFMRTNQGIDKTWSPGLSGHPTNRDVCLLGTENDGAYYTLDGGKTITKIALPACSGGIGPAKGRERILVWQMATVSFVFIQGVGLHRSPTGPDGEFLIVSGSPLHATSLYGEDDGTLWLTGDPRVPNATFTSIASPTQTSPDAGVWRLDPGADSFAFCGNPFSNILGYGPWRVVVDPHKPTNVIAYMEQGGAISRNRGQTWIPVPNYGSKMVPGGESAWRIGNMFVGAIRFTPKPGQILWGEGFGALITEDYESGIQQIPGYTNPERWVWRIEAKDYSRGIEEFIVNGVMSDPFTGKFWLSCWDRQICGVDSLTEYVNIPQLPVGSGLSPALSADVSIDGSRIVSAGGKAVAQHSFSDDGGKVFNLFDASPQHNLVFPPRVTDTSATPVRGGAAGAIAISTPNDICIVQSQNWPAVETRGRFNPATGVPDRAEDWSVIELDGSTNYCTINAYYVTRKSLAADKTRPGAFAMVVSNMDPQVRNSTANPLGGVWVRENEKAPWVQTLKGMIGSRGEIAQFWQCQFFAVPECTAEWMYSGYIGQAHCPLVHLLDDARTPVEIPDVMDVGAFGFCKNPGRERPAVLFRGRYKGELGFWFTDDWFASCLKVSDEFLNNYWTGGTPAIGGDMSPNGYGLFIVSMSGKGAVWLDIK